MRAAMVVGQMLCRLRAIADVGEVRRILDIDDLDGKLTVNPSASLVSTQVNEGTYSLATAAQSPSGETAMSLIGNVHLTSIFSYWLLSSEYMHTMPSSEPQMKKSFYPYCKRSPLPHSFASLHAP